MHLLEENLGVLLLTIPLNKVKIKLNKEIL